MNSDKRFQNIIDKLPSIYGLLSAFICAAFSELTLRHFLPTSNYLFSLSRVVVLFLGLYVIHRFALAGFKNYRPHERDFIVLVLIFTGSMFILWMSRFLALSVVSSSVAASFIGVSEVSSWNFIIPIATGSLILQAILGLHYGLVCGLNLSLVVALYLPSQQLLVPYVLATSLIACLSLSKFRSRSAYLQAGFNISLIALPFALASSVLEPNLLFSDVVIRLLGAVASGVLCAFIASGITPLFEYFGGYVTDLRLIEMATLDHPLLKDLSIQAPGTWNHSMVMGMMVESAADSIGANAVVARVGAYFHDIGKMTKPLYFVENQLHDENRHDKLSPSMSSLIIRSHVKEGIELAKQHKLPAIIEDMIPQHHGTSIIEYFYDKARKEAEEAGLDPEQVDISLYVYPGPKPQTKEAGILMLADGIEAASRTISEPTLDRIQGLVQKMINKVFASGELDECELTLRDLHQIAKCFTRVLNGIYHQRIAYVEPAEKTNSEKSAQNEETASLVTHNQELENTGQSEKSKTASEDRSNKKDTKEDLKRLGL